MTVTVTENGISIIQDNVTVGGGNGSGGFDVPVGTTAERPGSPTAGTVRYNTTESTYEGYDGSNWVQILTTGYPYTADFLVIATEWPEFRTPDFQKIKNSLRESVIFDGRNLFDLEMMKKHGFTYYSIGRTSIK